MHRVSTRTPPPWSARSALLVAALAAAFAARCTRARGGAVELVRLGDPAGAKMVEVGGEARLALRVAAGEVVRCSVALPSEPCWLDVAAAVLDDEPARGLDGVVLDVVRVAGGQRATLLHALLDAGTKPTAFGWGQARIEIVDHLGEKVELEFTVGVAPRSADAGRPPIGFALALPRLAARADANDRPWRLVDWLGEGPREEEFDGSGAPQRWPGHRKLLAASEAVDVVRAPSKRGSGGRPAAATTIAAVAASPLELQAFGSEDPADFGEGARRPCDRFARVDPFARDGDDPALRALAGLAGFDAERRADRARALGERTLQIELVRPRRTALAVEVTSLRDASACDAALARLLDFLAVNEAAERTLLLVRTRPAGGWGLVVARLPKGWRDQAPAALVARFDERAPEFAAR